MRSPQIVLDARMWGHAGIGRYVSELTTALLAGDFGFNFVFLSSEGFKKSILDPATATHGIEFKKTVSGIYGISEQIELPLRSLGADLFHAPHFNIPVFFPGKLVTTIHDLIYLRDPASLRSGLARAYASWILKVAQKKSSAIISVSQCTRADLLDQFPGLPPEKVFVIPEAASGRLRKVNEAAALRAAREKFGLRAPFVLFVGSLKPHKNVEGLVRAMLSVRQDGCLPHELVLVGRTDPKHPEILNFVQSHPFVKILGELADPDLALLYSMADLFVMPSFYEGFGLPLLEAMSCGVPAIASDRASLPEVLGGAGACFDPTRVDALSELLYNILVNRELREEMSKKGLERAAQFSWKNTAQMTAQVYQKVLGI